MSVDARKCVSHLASLQACQILVFKTLDPIFRCAFTWWHFQSSHLLLSREKDCQKLLKLGPKWPVFKTFPWGISTNSRFLNKEVWHSYKFGICRKYFCWDILIFKIYPIEMHWKQATRGLNSVTLSIPHSWQEQMPKLGILSFNYIKAHQKIGSILV